MKRVLEGDIMKGVLAQFGLAADDFGTHSARKGAATYVSSCSTSGPSAAAICLRAGWTLPGVQDKYVRFEAAGDMVVGRYVAGLPFDSPKFATLPPFFAPLTDQSDEQHKLQQQINIAMAAIFPGVPSSMRMICQFGLASMLYHQSFLQRELPSHHLLFATPLFSTSNHIQLEWLRQRVVCRNFKENDPISQSGIPPHVGIMVTLAQYKAELEGMRQGLIDKFEKSLKRHIQGSVMTMEAMETAFESVLARSSLCRTEQPTPDHSSEASAPPTTVSASSLYTWDSSFHRVPRDFSLPCGTIRVLWQHWCAGQPPLRLLSKNDMSSRAKKVRLAEMQRLMHHVESLLAEDELRRAHGSADAAGVLFAQIKASLSFPTSSRKGRERRLDQLSWQTLARELRSKNTR